MAFGGLRGYETVALGSLPSGTQVVTIDPAITVAIGDLIVVIASWAGSGSGRFETTGHSDSLGNTNPTTSGQPTGGYHQLSNEPWDSSNRNTQMFACRSSFAGSLTSVTLDSVGSTGQDGVIFVSVFEGPILEQTTTGEGTGQTTWLRANSFGTQDTNSPFTSAAITNSQGDLIVGWGSANHSNVWSAAAVGGKTATLIDNVNNASTVKVAMSYRIQDDEAHNGQIAFSAGSNPGDDRIGVMAIIPLPSINILPPQGDLTFLPAFTPTVTVSDNRFATPDAGTLTFTGDAPTVYINPSPEAAQLQFESFQPTVVNEPPGTRIPPPGDLRFDGEVAGVFVSDHTLIAPAQGQLSLSSAAPVLAIRYPSNSMALTGTATFELVPPLIVYAATREFITQPDDVLPNQPFRGTLQKALRLDRTILNGGGIGQVTLSWGEIELINAEGDYDDFIDMYAVDGRRVVLRIGHAGPPFVYDNYVTVFDGSATDWHIAEDIMRIEVRDNAYRLEVPAQPRIYLGTGGLEGSDDLVGKRVPRAWGVLSNITPTAVIPAELVYQVNDGAILTVANVYDGGVQLTPASPITDYENSSLLRGASQGPFGGGQDIEAGEYATCIAEGLIRLGGTPQGQVTADIHGLLFRGEFVATHADVIFSLVSAGTMGNDAATKLLIHFDGTQGSNVITDESVGGGGHIFTANGNAHIDTASYKFGGASGLFDGTGDYWTTPDHSDFTLGSGNFTIDFWFNCTAPSGTLEVLAGQGVAHGNDTNNAWMISREPNDRIRCKVFGGATTIGDVDSTTTFTDVVNPGWHHVGVVRSGSNLILFIDGIIEEQDSISGSVNDSTASLGIGTMSAEFPGSPWTGRIDEFRLSVGIARRTANFTVPATAFDAESGTAPVNCDTQSFARVNAAQPATIGYYLDEASEHTVADVIADIANSMGGWAGFRGRTGTFEVGIFNDPEIDVPTARYSRIDIVDGTLTREKLPTAFSPPPYRFRVVWSRNWTVQDDLFGAVDAARVAYVREPFRLARSDPTFETSVLADHPLAQDPPPIEAFFSEEQAAGTEADRLLSLYALVPRALYRFTVHSRPFVHEIGEVINLTYPRWGLDEGRNMRIVSVSENTDDNTTELIGFG